MIRASNVYTRFAVLIGVVMLLAIGSLPLLGNAQDATPAGAMNEQQLIQEGEKIYTNVCIACHQPDGMGIEGIYPMLNGNPLITNEDPTYFISTVLTGRGGMPPFEGIYSDEEIAAVTTFVRQNWENEAPAVSVDQVAAIRAELEATPAAEPTPFGQRPSGNLSASPESAASGSPEATPEATP
jgi:mono/diheme cytochrome c family protein